MPETPQSSPHPKPVQAALYIFGFALTAAGTYQVFQDRSDAGMLFLVGIVLILLANLDKVDYIKALGIEAKMRTLNEKMAEANEIVRQLRTLAVSTARHIITLVSCGDGYVETYSKRTVWEMIENVRKSLLDLEIAQSQIDEVLAPYHRKILNHFEQSFKSLASQGAVQVVVMNPASKEAVLLANELKSSSEVATDPAEWRRIAGMVTSFKRSTPHDNSVNQREMLELANDLEHWQATHRLRRPEAYFG